MTPMIRKNAANDKEIPNCSGKTAVLISKTPVTQKHEIPVLTAIFSNALMRERNAADRSFAASTLRIIKYISSLNSCFRTKLSP